MAVVFSREASKEAAKKMARGAKMDPCDLRNQLDPRSGLSPELVDPAQAQRPRPTVEDTLVDERGLAGHADSALSWNAESADLADSADQAFAFSLSFKSFYSSLAVLYEGERQLPVSERRHERRGPFTQ